MPSLLSSPGVLPHSTTSSLHAHTEATGQNKSVATPLPEESKDPISFCGVWMLSAASRITLDLGDIALNAWELGSHDAEYHWHRGERDLEEEAAATPL